MQTYTIRVDWNGRVTCQEVTIQGSLLESIAAALADISRQGYPDEITISKANRQPGKNPRSCNLYVFNLHAAQEADHAEQAATA